MKEAATTCPFCRASVPGSPRAAALEAHFAACPEAATPAQRHIVAAHRRKEIPP